MRLQCKVTGDPVPGVRMTRQDGEDGAEQLLAPGE